MSTLEAIGGGIVLLGAVVAALAVLGKWVRGLVHAVDRLQGLAQSTHEVTSYELTHNGGGSMKDKVEAALTSSRSALDSSNATRGLLELVAQELADHSRISRSAMQIYRKALADQGIHLPVAPGEGGYVDVEELT